MNARQMAEQLMDHKFAGTGSAVLLFDGAWYTRRMAHTRDWKIYGEGGARVTIGADICDVPFVEAMVNALVGRFTDPSTGGVRQHTESVNNFTVRTGKLLGIHIMYYEETEPGCGDAFYAFDGVFSNE